ncbi:hypothetical protein AGDE_05172 [Angomonas deanei]|uniref:Uncharacterized protein n=1 Tax=Angomonas deanei TaxID=59799 RepID=S9V6T6_9TRYP|nr:hypothetical protein AGDE_12470 [Angomonas deanei]EPY38757.1 hypothetical protein AGDE_05172 [Angomonas deanei]CAD2222762.1 hypothetical protein, conserved [Angomonas deanei]|eukprot:EPY24193.1 hypothetical protein AGDE_12470 [Angomonas deanei]
MSKAISIIAAGASPALLQAASTILTKVTGGAVKGTTVAQADKNAVVVGPEAPQGVIAAIVAPASSVDPAYKDVKTVVVRAVLPRREADAVQLRDALDVFPASGIDASAEVEKATAAFTKAAEVAAAQAKALQQARVTLVTKQVSKYKNLNELFVQSATKALEAAGLQVEVVNTAKVSNELLLFPERLGVVLVNDDPVCENIAHAYAGVLGGAPSTYVTASGSKISGGHSYKSVALALATELKQLGLTQEAGKLEAAAAKDPLNIAGAL